MLTNDAPEQSAQMDDVPKRPQRRRRRWTVLAATLAGVLVAFCGLTARLFIFPASGMPAHVDAIVMLNGPDSGSRFHTALNLAFQDRAKYLLISRGNSYYGQGDFCAPSVPNVKVICFDPNPPTTQGEAEYAGRLAKQYHWHSIAVVAITPQDSRARLRMERCFSGSVYVMTAPIAWHMWPYELAYEWGATVKALAFNRGC